MRGINRPAGSLGRSQACNLALRLWDDRLITDEVLGGWLQRLLDRNLWLDIGRKRPVPHEAWFQVAGYFFYYGHYYAALCLEALGKDASPVLAERLARRLMELQEKGGSWFGLDSAAWEGADAERLEARAEPKPQRGRVCCWSRR